MDLSGDPLVSVDPGGSELISIDDSSPNASGGDGNGGALIEADLSGNGPLLDINTDPDSLVSVATGGDGTGQPADAIIAADLSGDPLLNVDLGGSELLSLDDTTPGGSAGDGNGGALIEADLSGNGPLLDLNTNPDSLVSVATGGDGTGQPADAIIAADLSGDPLLNVDLGGSELLSRDDTTPGGSAGDGNGGALIEADLSGNGPLLDINSEPDSLVSVATGGDGTGQPADAIIAADLSGDPLLNVDLGGSELLSLDDTTPGGSAGDGNGGALIEADLSGDPLLNVNLSGSELLSLDNKDVSSSSAVIANIDADADVDADVDALELMSTGGGFWDGGGDLLSDTPGNALLGIDLSGDAPLLHVDPEPQSLLSLNTGLDAFDDGGFGLG
ncbi:MAG: hypothetical protein EOP62_08285 [Sphingomonadales bacterium]|nr:MAG: hypothetical protein EOP62_08285 [Sphingomonadales bacterium]